MAQAFEWISSTHSKKFGKELLSQKKVLLTARKIEIYQFK